MNKARTYANSYLYTKIPDYERNILEFVMSAERIDKNSEAFYGVVEDVKRRQTSAVLSRVLTRDDVILCVGNKPLPASFKVFACKDVKTDQKVKVFIDLTGLITIKNGFYNISKIDIFCSYLLSAMTNIIYNEDTTKLMSNSTIIQNATECFVNLSTHIFDYLRVSGFSENKNKIAYILAIYFQSTVLGLDRTDGSVKNLAAKLSTIPGRDINAMEIYFDDEDLININTVINCIVNTFKMKGVGTDIFIEKWTWFYGVGTQFATELFPAFATMLSDAYCGAYINNQKTIEKCCGRSMVNFTTTLLRVGGDLIDRGYKYESTLDRDIDRNHLTVTQEALFKPSHGKIANNFTESDFTGSGASLKKKMKDIVSQYNLKDKDASDVARIVYFGAAAIGDKYILGELKGYNGLIENTVAAVKPYLKGKDKDKVVDNLEKSCVNMTKMINDNSSTIKNMNETKKLRNGFKAGLKMMDPGNAALKESGYMYYKETDRLVQETFNEIDRVSNICVRSMNTDLSILEQYLTEGFLDSITSAIKAIFNAVKNFFSKLFGKAKEKCEEAKKDAQSNSNVAEDLDKIFKDNYKKVQAEGKNINVNFRNELKTRIDQMYQQAEFDIRSIKNNYHPGYTEAELNELKSKTTDAMKKAEEDMKKMQSNILNGLFITEESKDISEKVLDIYHEKCTADDVSFIEGEFNKLIKKIESIDYVKAASIGDTAANSQTGKENPGSEGDLRNSSLKTVSQAVLNIVKLYGKTLTLMMSTVTLDYRTSYVGTANILYAHVISASGHKAPDVSAKNKKNSEMNKETKEEADKSKPQFDTSAQPQGESAWFYYNDDIEDIIEDCESLLRDINDSDTAISESEIESFDEASNSIVNKVQSLIDSILGKIGKDKKSIKNKADESKKKSYESVHIDFSKYDVTINNYMELPDVEDIKKKCYDKFNDWVDPLMGAYDSICDTEESEEAVTKAMKNRKFLSDTKKKVKRDYDNIDIAKEVNIIFGFDKKPKKHRITETDYKNLLNNLNSMSDMYNSFYSTLDDWEHNINDMRRKVYKTNSNRNDNSYYAEHKDMLKYHTECAEVLCYILSLESELADKYMGISLDKANKYIALLNDYNNAIVESSDSIEEEAIEVSNARFQKYIDRITRESDIYAENAVELFRQSTDTDLVLFEDYLTEGLVDSFVNAIKAIFTALKNFIDKLFGRSKDELKENSKDNKSKVGLKWKLTYQDTEKTFKQNYKNVKVENAMDSNFANNNLVPMLSKILDQAKADVQGITATHEFQANITEQNLDALKNSVKDASDRAKENIKKLVGDIKMEDIFCKKSNKDTIDVGIFDAYCGNNIEKDNSIQQRNFKKLSDDLNKIIGESIAKNRYFADITKASGGENISAEEAEPINKLLNEAKNVIINARVDVAMEYRSSVQTLCTRFCKSWYPSYQLKCKREVDQVIQWAKDNGKLVTFEKEVDHVA